MNVLSNQLIWALQRARTLHEAITCQQLQLFLTVASYEWMYQREIPKAVDSTEAAVSRNIGLLGDEGSRGSPGLGLIRSEVDKWDRRQKIISLTPKGEALVRELAELMRSGPGHSCQ